MANRSRSSAAPGSGTLRAPAEVSSIPASGGVHPRRTTKVSLPPDRELLSTAVRHVPGGRIAQWFTARREETAVWLDIRAFPPLAVWGGLNGVAVLIAARRFTDVQSLKITNSQIILAAAAAALLALLARASLARIERQRPAGWLRLTAAALCATPIFSLLLAMPRRASLFGAAGYVAALGLGGGIAGLLWSREVVERLLTSLFIAPHGAKPCAISLYAGEGGANESAMSERAGSNANDDDTTLWIKRSNAGGEDRLVGGVAAHFAPAQSLAVVHVAFCPTFAAPPEFVCEIEDAGVRVKGTTVYPYGCRLELKRTGNTASAATVELRFAASLDAPVSRAA